MDISKTLKGTDYLLLCSNLIVETVIDVGSITPKAIGKESTRRLSH